MLACMTDISVYCILVYMGQHTGLFRSEGIMYCRVVLFESPLPMYKWPDSRLLSFSYDNIANLLEKD